MNNENKNLTPSDVSENSEAARTLASEAKSHVKVLTPGQLVAKRFFRSRLSVVGLSMLIFLFVFSFICPLFQNLPFIWGQTEQVGATRVVTTTYERLTNTTEYLRNDGKWISYNDSSEIVDADLSDGEVQTKKVTYVGYEVRSATATNKTKPTLTNWLGTDTYGYDVLSRLMFGGRISLSLSFLVIFAELILGIIMGGLSGYFGGWVDMVIMRLVDILNCLPGLPILMICSSMLDGWKVPAASKIYWLMGILTIFGWSGIARLVRGQILSLREQEFMIAAEASGLTTGAKIFKHLIPNVMPQLIVQATLGLGGIILYESTLSYLGLGVPFPYAAWGSMIAMANPSAAGGRDILLNFPNLWIPAGLCIMLAVLGFNFVGDGLRDAFDPKMKR